MVIFNSYVKLPEGKGWLTLTGGNTSHPLRGEDGQGLDDTNMDPVPFTNHPCQLLYQNLERRCRVPWYVLFCAMPWATSTSNQMWVIFGAIFNSKPRSVLLQCLFMSARLMSNSCIPSYIYIIYMCIHNMYIYIYYVYIIYIYYIYKYTCIYLLYHIVSITCKPPLGGIQLTWLPDNSGRKGSQICVPSVPRP